MHTRMPLDALLKAVWENANLPRDEAEAPPPQAFFSEDLLALEVENIFNHEWHCVGREDEFADIGAYRTLVVGHDPVMVIRDSEGALRAMSNVCRHRMMTLLESQGRCERHIVCPYHAWTYDLEGRLIGAAHMRDDFDRKSCRLPQYRVEVWEGWVYVNLDPKASSLGPRLTGISDRYSRHRISQYRTLFRVEEIWDTNWKILVQNFMEGYHLFRVHAKTVEHALPTRLSHVLPGSEGYCLFEQGRVPGVPYEYGSAMDSANPDLSDEESNTVVLFCVFPCHVISLSPERTFWMALQPHGVDGVRVLWGVDVFPGAFPDGEEGIRRAQELRAVFDRINEEDKPVVAAIARNARAHAATPGRLSPKELTIWEFQRYLAGRLCATPPHHAGEKCGLRKMEP